MIALITWIVIIGLLSIGIYYGLTHSVEKEDVEASWGKRPNIIGSITAPLVVDFKPKTVKKKVSKKKKVSSKKPSIGFAAQEGTGLYKKPVKVVVEEAPAEHLPEQQAEEQKAIPDTEPPTPSV
jgi:hypothetical protein